MAHPNIPSASSIPPLKPRKPEQLVRAITTTNFDIGPQAPVKPPKLSGSQIVGSSTDKGRTPADAARHPSVGRGHSSSAANVSALPIGRPIVSPSAAGLERVQSAAVLPSRPSAPASEKALLEGIFGVRELMKKRSWRLVQKNAERYRKESEGIPHLHFQFRLAYVMALIKFRLYRNAQEDIDALGDLDDTRYTYEHYPALYPGLTGSFVPFTLRIIKAELPSFLNLAFHSIDLLFALVDRCRKELALLPAPSTTQDVSTAAAAEPIEVESEDLWLPRPRITGDFHDTVTFTTKPKPDLSPQLWRQRLHRLIFSIATRFCLDREYPSALEVLQTQIDPVYQNDPALLSAIARINLQMGNLQQATATFQQVDLRITALGLISQPFEVMRATNRALLAFTMHDYQAAAQEFSRVLELNPENYHATNNLAICCLYDKKLSKAISSFEASIRSNPHQNLVEPLVLNLCALYDLESENSTSQKREMWKLVSKHADDAFDFSVLKLKLT